MTRRDDEKLVRVGTWLYAGHVPAEVQLVRREFTIGTGDYEDPPEIRDSHDVPCYYFLWGHPSEPGVFKAASAQYQSLDDALTAAETIVEGGIKWHLSEH
jgi:hypothetical protein